MACIMALLLGAIYFQQGLSQASIQSRVGAISFSMLLMSFIAFDIVLLFPKERDLYTRESQAGLYGASAFFHARCLAELPGHLTAGGAYATIAYWMMGFQNSAMKFAHFFLLCEAVVFAGTSLLIFCGCCAKDFEMANNYATVFFCLFMMCPRPAPRRIDRARHAPSPTQSTATTSTTSRSRPARSGSRTRTSSTGRSVRGAARSYSV